MASLELLAGSPNEFGAQPVCYACSCHVEFAGYANRCVDMMKMMGEHDGL